MPLLSFSVFFDKIVSGEKRNTIRETRINPIKAGDTLYLWWKSRSSSERRYIGKVTCTEVVPVEITGTRLVVGGTEITDVEEKTAFAKADGFESLADFETYFKAEPKRPRVLIKWENLKQ